MPLNGFHPAIQTWFARRFGEPTPPQRQGWPLIRAGHHTLISAPTGTGKTLAAYLSAIDSLARCGTALPDETVVLYVSPLRALSNDVQKNLQGPMAELAALDPTFPAIRVMVRTGDTAARDRAAMLRKPPHILVTTPESLYILLTSAGGREMLKTVKTVIIDEIHALARDKRGSHLALSLERLEALAGPFQRIGLSATQKPLIDVGRFLVGVGRECELVDIGHRRDMDVAIVVPPTALSTVCSHEQWDEIYNQIAQLIDAHRTTLLFVNTRKLAERITARLTEVMGEEKVTCHHSSLSRERRLDAEQRLKAGTLRALVATASLELGIDIGEVDLVIQVGATRSIATFLQRVGRSGHAVRGRPKGRLFPLTIDELVEAAALLRAAARGELDRTPQPAAPLDILAQQIVAACVAAGEPGWHEETLFNSLRRAWPYRDLKREDFDAVLRMHTDGRRGLLHRDGVGGRVMARKRARITAITGGGAIPDVADYQVLVEPEGTFVGTLNEDFAVESNVGDIFQLGNMSWRVLKVERGAVRVADAKGQPPSIPFWLGEGASRTAELSREIADLREEWAGRIASNVGSAPRAVPFQAESTENNLAPRLAAPLAGRSRGSGAIGIPEKRPASGAAKPVVGENCTVGEHAHPTTDISTAGTHSSSLDDVGRALPAVRALGGQCPPYAEQARIDSERAGCQPLTDSQACRVGVLAPQCPSPGGETVGEYTHPTREIAAGAVAISSVSKDLSEESAAGVFTGGSRSCASAGEDTGGTGAPSWEDTSHLPPEAATQIADYIADGRRALGTVPTQKRIILERFFDESGGMQMVLHAPFGGRINRAWGLALRKRFCRGFGFELQAAANEEAIVISLGLQHSFPLEDVFNYLHPNSVKKVLTQAVLDQPMFESRWRWNATRSLVLERFQNGKKVPPAFLRMRAADLLAAAFPAAVACPENLPPGDLEIPMDHPLVRQTIDDCLSEATDIVGLTQVLEELRSGAIERVAVDTVEPSAFARGILNGQLYTFLDDAPLEERRTQAVMTRRSLDAKSLDGIGALDPAAVERVRQEAWPQPESAEEVHDALLWMGYVTDEETGEWIDWLMALAAQNRVLHKEERWFAADGMVEPKKILLGRLEALGPVSPAGLEESLLSELEHEGKILRTRMDGQPMWCERRLLARIHRYTLDRLRHEIEPVSASAFLQFLACWQHVDADYQLDGPHGVGQVLRQLAGFDAPAWAWESQILPRRVKGYRREWLDEVTLSGEFAWGRFWGGAASAIRITPITFVPREQLDSWLSMTAAPSLDGMCGPASDLLKPLSAQGAMFPQLLQKAAGLVPAHVEMGLADLLARGLITCDSFAALRQMLTPRSRRKNALRPVGRWSCLRRAETPAADADEQNRQIARQLLARTGVVFRRTVMREKLPINWFALTRIFRQMELRGEIRGGRFVAGFSGEQYALPEAVELLRALRRQTTPREAVSVMSADPLNFQGILTPEKRVAPAARQQVLVG
jgi:ATP-dependent Lhr-like helicase